MDLNYIKQLNASLELLRKSENIKAIDVSMYVALFQLWNIFRFNNPISVNRSELMGLSKIGSPNTYSKSLHRLTNTGLIKYRPSNSPLIGSLVYMYTFEHACGLSDEQVLVSSIKSTNSKKQNKPTKSEVIIFFKNNDSNEAMANTFFEYYKKNGWKTKRGPIQSWKAVAKTWLVPKENLTNEVLDLENDLDYDIPL